MEQRELTCIGCPMGCQLTVTVAEGAARQVAGNACPRGEQYAREEVSRPVRMVTSTVPVRGGEIPRVSVKTAAAVPKEAVFAVMAQIHTLTLDAPVQAGQVLLPDVAATGVPWSRPKRSHAGEHEAAHTKCPGRMMRPGHFLEGQRRSLTPARSGNRLER